VELLVDITSMHDITATGATLGPLGKIGEIRPLPPTLLLQYHLLPEDKVPYPFADWIDLDTEAAIRSPAGRATVDVDPLVYGACVGWRF